MRVVWFVLESGRSIIAGCGTITRAALESALGRSGATITVASDDSVEQIPTAAVRDFLVFETRGRFPDQASIYRSLVL